MNCINCGSEMPVRTYHDKVRKFCNSRCYGEWQRGKNFLEQNKPTKEFKACSVDGCGKKHFARTFCRRHYMSIFYKPAKPRIAKHVDTVIKPRKERRKRSIISCIHCGKEFLPPLHTSKYCSRKCSADHKKKPFIKKKGYKKILIPGHARADRKGYVFEHIVVIESYIGRAICWPEEVHHLDNDKGNNSPSNLFLCSNHQEHMTRFHR